MTKNSFFIEIAAKYCSVDFSIPRDIRDLKAVT
jgi:hypothetical protein